VLSCVEKTKKFVPKTDFNHFSKKITYDKEMKGLRTATKLAGRKIKVAIVTIRAVALSSTVSLVILNMLLLISTDVTWFLRFRVTESWEEAY
jgi:hypothetical protein